MFGIGKNSQEPKKLDFLIAGTQKAGTYALYNYLGQHPEVALSDKKELHFFDNGKHFRHNKPDYKALHKHIRYTKVAKVAGECTPIYMYWLPALPRIWEYNNNIKIILLLRNPVHRAFAQWNMNQMQGRAPQDFYEYITKESDIVKQDLPLQSRWHSYIDRGFYSEQIRRMQRFFKKENILILKYETFRDNQAHELNKVFDFLGVNKNLFTFKEQKINTTKYTREITQNEKEYLLKIFKNETSEIENMLGWNCNDWRV